MMCDNQVICSIYDFTEYISNWTQLQEQWLVTPIQRFLAGWVPALSHHQLLAK